MREPKDIKIGDKTLQEILELHTEWVKDYEKGQRAKLNGANLSGADLSAAEFSEADLSEADLRGADLNEADLRGANLSRADLSEANLSEANLRIADLSETELSRANLSRADLRGADLSEANLSEADLNEADLRGANLRGADLRGADLRISDLSAAVLVAADLSAANLRGADLRISDISEANLSEADLSAANLRAADLNEADLRGANLSRADLSEAGLNGVNLRETNFEYVILGLTIFAFTDLSSTKNLKTCLHLGPSSIDHSTLVKSGQLPLSFLRGIGLPDLMIEYFPSILGKAIEFYSCFISYCHKDEQIAKRLHADLQDNGVRCWFAPEDIRSGRKVYDQIDSAIRMYEKLLLILSVDSMNSEWVKTEIARARKKERELKKQVLFPIRLVDFEKIKEWECFDADSGKDSAREIREYYIEDFSNWKDHESYKKAFKRLLRDLKQDSKPPVQKPDKGTKPK